MEIERVSTANLFKRSKPIIGGHLSDNDFFKNDTKNDKVKSVEIRKNEVAAKSWRGQGGGNTSLHSVQFDKQMDNISLWLEHWGHQTRCNILEALLTRCKYNQIRLLWTVVQPATHRDFMFSAQKHFPGADFTPISTHTSRVVKEKLLKLRHQYTFHRINSAYLQPDGQRTPTQGSLFRLPSIADTRSSSGYESLEVSSSPAVSGSREGTVSARSALKSVNASATSPQLLSRLSLTWTKPPGTANSAMTIPNVSLPKTPEVLLSKSCLKVRCKSMRDDLLTTQRTDGQSHPSLINVNDAPACISKPSHHRRIKRVEFIEMPVRRHVQNESPRLKSVSSSRVNKFNRLDFKSGRITKHELSKHKEFEHLDIPKEGWEVLYWFTDCWNDAEKNEFLHKLLLKLDPRQHYFILTFLAKKQHVDFVSVLPHDIVARILSYLTPQDIIRLSTVNKTWFKACNNNELWKLKAKEIKLEIPITSTQPDWKKIYRENLHIKSNWVQGKCNVIECNGHDDRVLSVTFDTKRMATGSLDKTIRVWDLRDGRCLQTLKGHTKGVWCLRFFTKVLLISASYDSTIKIWNLRYGTCIRTLLGHQGPVWTIVLRNNLLVSVSQDKTGKVWDIGRCMLLHTLRGHTGAVFAADMDEDGSLIITGSADRTLRLWDSGSGEQLKFIWVNAATTSIMSVSYSLGWIACSHDTTICLYKADTSKLHRTFKEHKKRIESLQLKMNSGDKMEGSLVSSGQDAVIKYWNINRSQSVHTFSGHNKRINCVHFDETRIASASYDNKINIWDFNIPRTGKHDKSSIKNNNE